MGAADASLRRSQGPPHGQGCVLTMPPAGDDDARVAGEMGDEDGRVEVGTGAVFDGHSEEPHRRRVIALSVRTISHRVVQE